MRDSKLTEVFRTDHGVVYQCNARNMFRLDFADNHSYFKVSDFLDFIKKVNGININEMANNISRSHDIEILMPHYTDRCFVLTIRGVLDLRELLNGASFMLNLNCILRECLFQTLAL